MKFIIVATYCFSQLLSTPLCFSQIPTQATLPIIQNDSEYEGPGVDWILERADSCQFVLFGEQHGVHGVAEFVTFINKQLDNQDFDYLALETDGWTTSKAAELGVNEFTSKYPHSIAFDSNGDLKLMQSAIDLNTEAQSPIWGLDQMQTAIHPFQRLVELAETPEQKRIARGAFLKATLKMGRYTRQNHQKDIEVLEEVFDSNSSVEINQILSELRKTIEIFTKWMNPDTRQESVAIREELMKANLDNYIKIDPKAKVLFKMGGAHTIYGIGPNGVLTLGDHAQKIAKKNDQSTLNISILRYNPENSLIPARAFDDNNITLLDSKAYLQENPNDSANQSLKGFDAMIYLKDAGYASKSINRLYEKNFRNSIVKSLSPLIICVIISLVTILSFLFQAIRKKSTSLLIPSIASILAIVLIVFQILEIRSSVSSAAISAGYTPLLIHFVFGIFSVFFSYQSFLIFKNQEIKSRIKAFYAVFTVSFLLISFLIHYWNIGGMLGIG